MSNENGNLPAMPQSVAIGPSGDVEYSERDGGGGMTKREQFAAMAMQGMLSNKYVSEFSTEINDDGYDMPNGLANNAVRYADALLAQPEGK